MGQNWLLLRYQPLKFVYFSYVVATLVFVKLPLWTIWCIIPALRPRSTWPISRALLVWSLRDIVIAAFNTASFNLARVDPRTQKKDAEKLGLVWADATPDLIVGEVQKLAKVNMVETAPVAGYWYGKRDPRTNLAGQPAGPNEKVIYNFHCAFTSAF